MAQETQTGANLEVWDGEGDGSEVQKGGDICIPMADSCCSLTGNSVQQLSFCKAIVLQLKKKGGEKDQVQKNQKV